MSLTLYPLPRPANSYLPARTICLNVGDRILRLGAIGFLAALLSLSCANIPHPDQGEAGLFYIDSVAGLDTNPGTDPALAWKSLGRAAQANIPPGSVVHLKRGGQWRERLQPKTGLEGEPVSYRPYGEGPKPLLNGSRSAGDSSAWAPAAALGMWKARCAEGLDVGALFWTKDGQVLAYGQKKWRGQDCLAPGDFWYDAEADCVELRWDENPSARFAGAEIELALNDSIVNYSGKSWIVFEGLDLRYAGGFGFNGKDCDNIVIRGCDISWIGGSEMSGSTHVRYGNGVQFFGDAQNCRVEGNRIWEIFDTGITNQCYYSSVERDLVYVNNIIWNCGYASFEFWNSGERSISSGIRFEHNSCFAAGEGWGGDQDRSNANTAGAHLRLDACGADTSGILIRNNIFMDSRVAGALVMALGEGIDSWEGWADLILDNNCWWDSDGGPLWLFFDYQSSSAFCASDIDAYRAQLGKEAHSLAADPLFLESASSDFRLSPNSPCIGAGASSDISTDIDGNSRDSQRDIGAWEYR